MNLPLPDGHRRSPKETPLPAPDGYRWEFRTETTLNVAGLLELVDDRAYYRDGVGLMLWIDRPVPRSRKLQPRPYTPEVTVPVRRPRGVRRASRRALRLHYQITANLHARTLLAARIRAGLNPAPEARS